MESAAIYGLESQSRALCSFPNEIESVRFYVGTLSTRSEGQIHQIDFEDDTNQITRRIHKPKVGEIWQLQVAPSGQYLGLCYNEITDSSCKMRSCIWAVPEENSSEVNEKVVSIDTSVEAGSVRNLDWHPTKPDHMAVACQKAISLWDLNEGKPKLKASSKLEDTYSCRWNPHLDGNQCAVISAHTISGYDIRTMKEAWTISKAHKFQVRDVDFNPNKQYYAASCGDDCCARFWDFRNPNVPLKEIECHSHWIWRVRFNSFHDQLILTASSDTRVILHALPSISSEPHGRTVFSDSEEEDRSSTAVLEEGTLATYEEHEDAVYAVEWSSYDPWSFASLSYDGRLVINRVPKSHKYKLLL